MTPCPDCHRPLATDAHYYATHDERTCERTGKCWCRAICWVGAPDGGCWDYEELRAEIERLRALVKEEDRWPTK